MAGQTKKTTKKKSSARNGKRTKKQQKPPIRREVGAFVCLFLALFTILGCFHVEGTFLDFLTTLFKGLVGSGFIVLPVAFVMGFLILILHDGRPVALRVTCTFLMVVTIGALVQLVGGQDGADWSWQIFRDLWESGNDGTSGGILSGLIAQSLAMVISKPGAVIVLLAAFIWELLTGLNMTIKGIITAVRNRPRAEYAEPQLEHKDPAEVIVNHVAQKHIESVERRRPRSEFDLPVDEPPLPVREPAAQAKKPIRPDEYLEGRKTQRAAAREEAARNSYKQQFEQLLAETHAEPVFPTKLPPLIVEQGTQTPPVAPVAQKPAAQPAMRVSEAGQLSLRDMPSEEELPPLAQPEPETVKKEEVQQEAALIEQQIAAQEQPPEYQFPPVELLRPSSGAAADGTDEMRQNAERLADTLQSFNIDAQIINVTRGPSITRYELELSRGTKLSKITNLADDIALSLGASGVRIAAIPEKISVVGIEVPNKLVSTVVARDVIDSQEFTKSKSRISFAVGKDIGGSRIIGDIGRLPHMLIAGTTGSGKSVCMNSLIISLLYKAKPEEVKLIMVDPKMVELGIYNGIPHLLIPVVTDPKKAAGALQWGVTEMLRRYRMMADSGVRDLESYNKIAKGSDELESMPQIVVVIDELADLMLVAAKEVEESICRIAQMGRAAGIHLVIATQRPSADVITGLMKANIPSRIAFAVASAMESRIILDTAGAEKLVGKGDMLYAPLGQGKPKRVQGCFITDEEVASVVEFVKKSNTAEYSDTVMQEIEKKAAESGKSASASATVSEEPAVSDGDEMLPQAVDVILETGQASVSMLQRRLKLGYARAARIMDEMEEKGIVGPFEGSKPRQLLITREQWETIRNGGAVSDNPPVEEEIP